MAATAALGVAWIKEISLRRRALSKLFPLKDQVLLRLGRLTPFSFLNQKRGLICSPASSIGEALRPQVADALDANCQLVEAETDLDQNPTFPGSSRSGDWITQDSGRGQGALLSRLTTVYPHSPADFAPLSSRRRS